MCIEGVGLTAWGILQCAFVVMQRPLYVVCELPLCIFITLILKFINGCKGPSLPNDNFWREGEDTSRAKGNGMLEKGDCLRPFLSCTENAN